MEKKSKSTEPAASTATKKAAGEPPADRKPQPDVPQSIDLIADAVGEMLTQCTTDECLDHLLTAAITHIARRTQKRGIGKDDENSINEAVNRAIKRDFEPWKEDVTRSWLRTWRKSPAAIEPATIVERIRANVRQKLEDKLEIFLAYGKPEELRFLLEVMVNYESVCNMNPAVQTSEMCLGRAFDYELGRANVYLRAPEALRGEVEDYIQRLMAVDRKEA